MAVLKILKDALLFLYLTACRSGSRKPKKIKASTLIESLVASVLIVVIFTIASLTLNNVFRSTIKSNTGSIENRMNTIEYLYLKNKISERYSEEFENWDIQLGHIKENNYDFLVIEATQNDAKRKLSKKIELIAKK